MQPLPAERALESYFLEARSKLLDLAGILDRIDRGPDAPGVTADIRLSRIRQALEVLKSPTASRAERIQQIFSLEYDASWLRPKK